MILKNRTSTKVIAENLTVADSFLKRLRGLMFTKELPPQSALYIYPCSGIHTYFMRYNIDVLYLDSNNVILAIDEEMKPGRIGKYYKNAVAVIELKGGRVRESGIKVGQAVEILQKEG